MNFNDTLPLAQASANFNSSVRQVIATAKGKLVCFERFHPVLYRIAPSSSLIMAWLLRPPGSSGLFVPLFLCCVSAFLLLILLVAAGKRGEYWKEALQQTFTVGPLVVPIIGAKGLPSHPFNAVSSAVEIHEMEGEPGSSSSWFFVMQFPISFPG